METNYNLAFDEVMVKQLKKAAKNHHIKEILTKMLDKLELSGPDAGELLDPQLSLYEVKIKHPPIRIYFKHNKATREIYVFEFEMKTSPEKQKTTIIKLKKKLG
jgi:mRNA-degrading endonuclease RelE of RelBE toxin-antitoxin system